MLVLSRHRDESIMIGDNIVITVVDVRGDKVRLGIDAPTDIPVHRQEVYDAIQREGSLPTELVGMARGVVYEELAELVPGRSLDFATKALLDLGVNRWFCELEPERWARLHRLATGRE